jgi:hypothetical protein
MYASLSIRSAASFAAVVDLINDAPFTEGMQGIEFTAEQLAGQYAAEAQIESGYAVDEAALEAQLEFLSEGGANFDAAAAIRYGKAFAKAATQK